MRKNIVLGVVFTCMLLLAAEVMAVDLKVYTRSPMGGRWKSNIENAVSVLEEVRGVRLIVTPQDMMKESVPDAPAVMIDNEIIAENGKKGNGMVSENEILSILKRHGAIIIADDE